MGKARVKELKNVDVGYVSFVREGANGKKFQIFKSADFTPPDDTAQASVELPLEIEKGKRTLKEVIEDIIHGMFSEDNKPNEQTKEEGSMDETIEAIREARDSILESIRELRETRAEGQTPPPASNAVSEAELALSNSEGNETQEEEGGNESDSTDVEKLSVSISELAKSVASMSEDMTTLNGKVEAIAKQRNVSNSLADTEVRTEVQKDANGNPLPDFSNIFA